MELYFPPILGPTRPVSATLSSICKLVWVDLCLPFIHDSFSMMTKMIDNAKPLFWLRFGWIAKRREQFLTHFPPTTSCNLPRLLHLATKRENLLTKDVPTPLLGLEISFEHPYDGESALTNPYFSFVIKTTLLRILLKSITKTPQDRLRLVIEREVGWILRDLIGRVDSCTATSQQVYKEWHFTGKDMSMSQSVNINWNSPPIRSVILVYWSGL